MILSPFRWHVSRGQIPSPLANLSHLTRLIHKAKLYKWRDPHSCKPNPTNWFKPEYNQLKKNPSWFMNIPN